MGRGGIPRGGRNTEHGTTYLYIYIYDLYYISLDLGNYLQPLSEITLDILDKDPFGGSRVRQDRSAKYSRPGPVLCCRVTTPCKDAAGAIFGS